MDIEAVWLRREGGDAESVTDLGHDVVVLLRIDGRWVEVIRDSADSDFSSAVTERKIRSLL